MRKKIVKLFNAKRLFPPFSFLVPLLRRWLPVLPWRSRAAAPLPSLPPVLVVLILSAPILALPAPRPLTPALTLVVVVVTGVPVLTVVVARVPVFPVVVAWVSVVSVIPGFPVSRRGKMIITVVIQKKNQGFEA